MRFNPVTYGEFEATMKRHNIPFVKEDTVEGAGTMHEFSIPQNLVLCFTECKDTSIAEEIWNEAVRRAFKSYNDSGKINKPMYYTSDVMKTIIFPRMEIEYSEHTIMLGTMILTIVSHNDYLEETKKILKELSLLAPIKVRVA